MASYERRSSPVREQYRDIGSPDPLNDSDIDGEDDFHVTPPSASKTRYFKASANHRRKSSDIEIPVSPSKMSTEHCLSPWRIMVTVEAQPEDESGEDAPTGRTRTVTRTMKVPLRQEGSPTRTTEGISGTRRKNSRNSVSPARAIRSRRQSVTDLDIVVLGDDAEENEWSAKPKSPRKRRPSKTHASQKLHLSSRKTPSDTFDIREDGGGASPSLDIAQSTEHGSPELKQIDLNQVLMRSRSNSVKQKSTDRAMSRSEDARKVSINSTLSYPTPSPTVSERGDSDNREHLKVGFDTVMESEGFTMIDLESLPSVKQLRQSPNHPAIIEEHEETDQNISLTQTEVADNSAIEAPSIAVTSDDTGISSNLPSSPPTGGKHNKKAYSIGHLQLPSSTNVQRHRLVTPMPVDKDPYSSPKLPSPPRAPASLTKERSPVHSDQALQAGSALQGAMKPEGELTRNIKANQTSDTKEEALFGGFSSSTRRELRAELRFGEELGRKQLQQVSEPGKPVAPSNEQVWRGETIAQQTPPVTTTVAQQNIQDPKSTSTSSQDDTFASKKSNLELVWQQERDAVIKKADKDGAIVIDSDHEDQDSGVELDETVADIWLAEAQQASSSPKESVKEPQVTKDTSLNKPRRSLIPSPWKRGQHIEPSQLTEDGDFSGMFWKQVDSESVAGRFGEAIIANPEKANGNMHDFDRRRSGEFDAETLTPKPSRRLSPRREADIIDDDQDTEENDFDADTEPLNWRDAEDVIEEETNELEAERSSNTPKRDQRTYEVGTTHLYETNLEDVPEQDLSSSPQVRSGQKQQQDESSIEPYRWRTSLSPSKERPNTPRSALRGGRVSLGRALSYNDSDDTNGRRVVWATRAKCVDERWEESTRSVRSTQESSCLDETPASTDRQVQQGIEATFEVQSQPPQPEQPKKSWFKWFTKDDNTAQSRQDSHNSDSSPVRPESSRVHSLDGSIDTFIKSDNEDDRPNASYAPTSRHSSVQAAPVDTRLRSQPRQSTSANQPAPSAKTKVPSYLLPPSYPSDRTRDPSIPLPTSGPFTNTHFRTLNIIHRKSTKAGFHGPSYPTEIRPSILHLADTKHKIQVDESATMGEDGLFEFVIGGTEARVLERFMREVEHGHVCTTGAEVEWGWSVEQLAERLARVVIGERIREEERAVEGILGAGTMGRKR